MDDPRSLIFFVLLVLGVPALSYLAVWFVRHRYKAAELVKHNDAAGIIFSMVGTLYAFLLAFVGIVAWEDMNAAEARVGHEAGVLGDLVRDAKLLDFDEAKALEDKLCEYAKVVVLHEFKGYESKEARGIIDETFDLFGQLEPEAARDVNIHAEIFSRLNDLSELRRERLLSVESEVPILMWALLGLGAVVTLGFCFLIGVEKFATHALMILGLSTMIGLTLFLIVSIDHPFQGTLSVQPTAFCDVVDLCKRQVPPGCPGKGSPL